MVYLEKHKESHYAKLEYANIYHEQKLRIRQTL